MLGIFINDPCDDCSYLIMGKSWYYDQKIIRCTMVFSKDIVDNGYVVKKHFHLLDLVIKI